MLLDALSRPGGPRAGPSTSHAVPRPVLGRPADLQRRARPPAAAHAAHAVRHRARGARPLAREPCGRGRRARPAAAPSVSASRATSTWRPSRCATRTESGALAPVHARTAHSHPEGPCTTNRRSSSSGSIGSAASPSIRRCGVPASSSTRRCGRCPTSPDGTVGEPVAVEGRSPPTTGPAGPGTTWGRPWGTVWFRLVGTVPDEWAGRPVDAILNLGFNDLAPGFMGEGMVWRRGRRRRGSPSAGCTPANHVVLFDRSRRGRRARRLPRRGVGEPAHVGTPVDRPTATGDTAGSHPIYVGDRDRPGACATSTSSDLHHDLRTVIGLRSQSSRSTRPAPGRSLARDRSQPRRARPRRRVGHRGRAGPRRAGRGAVAAGGAVGPPHLRRRPRPHRLRLALAAPRDRAQVRPHVLERAAR